jgi:hypothetical protein
MKKKSILRNSIIKFFIINVLVVIISVRFFTAAKQASANSLTIKFPIAGFNDLKSTEEDVVVVEPSNHAIDLLEISDSNRLNIKFIKYQNADIEIGDRSCRVVSPGWQIKHGSTIANLGTEYFYYSDFPPGIATIYLPNSSISKITINLERKKAIFPFLNESCNTQINITRELDNVLLLRKPVHILPLERNIQNSWFTLDTKVFDENQ